MKHLLRNALIFFFTYTGIAPLYRKIIQNEGPLTRVVAFHDVDDGEWFRHIIASLAKEFHILSPHDFEQRTLHDKKINILITFDDGYKSWVDVCAPVLKEYGIKGLFFVNSGLLAAHGDEDATQTFVKENLRLSPKKTLSFEGMRELLREGHTCGGHTAHHRSLKGVAPDMVRSEVEDDKRVLEEELGVALRHFAYPFGTSKDYSGETEALIHSFGYTFVYIAEPGFSRVGGHHIPRTLVEKHQSYKSLARCMYGGYDIFVYLKRFLSSFKVQTDSY
jgi:peptidoglycan/xylan/chitin deacetylase (PgdA/CDA1 family)